MFSCLGNSYSLFRDTLEGKVGDVMRFRLLQRNKKLSRGSGDTDDGTLDLRNYILNEIVNISKTRSHGCITY